MTSPTFCGNWLNFDLDLDGIGQAASSTSIAVCCWLFFWDPFGTLGRIQPCSFPATNPTSVHDIPSACSILGKFLMSWCRVAWSGHFRVPVQSMSSPRGTPLPSRFRQELMAGIKARWWRWGMGEFPALRSILKILVGVSQCFHLWGWYPQMVGLEWKIPSKWMMTGGTAISGNHYLGFMSTWLPFYTRMLRKCSSWPCCTTAFELGEAGPAPSVPRGPGHQASPSHPRYLRYPRFPGLIGFKKLFLDHANAMGMLGAPHLCAFGKHPEVSKRVTVLKDMVAPQECGRSFCQWLTGDPRDL